MLVTAFVDGLLLFWSFWSDSIGIPAWIVALVVGAICLLGRASHVALGDGYELVRRRRILERLRQTLPVAIEKNQEQKARTHFECIRRRVLRWVSAEPIAELTRQRGIGTRTIEHLRAAGFHTELYQSI